MKSRTNSPNTEALHAFPSVDVAVLQTLFDLAPDVAFFVKDALGRYVTVNDSLVIRHGLKRKSDAIGKYAVFDWYPALPTERIILYARGGNRPKQEG